MKRGCAIILIAFLFSACGERSIRVGLQPLDDFDPALTDTIARALAQTYRVKTYLLPAKRMPAGAFINVKTPRYRADRIISLLREEKPDSLTYIMALTGHDISTTKKDASGRVKEPAEKYTDWGIFGLGYSPGPSCVVSTFRIKNAGDETCRQRLKKIAIHELGHNLGLGHCTSPLCVMQDAVESIKTIDRVNAGLCERCRDRLNMPPR